MESIIQIVHFDSKLIIGVLGAIGGSLLTIIVQYVLLRRSYSLKLWERLIDKRINAHMKVMEVATELRSMFIISSSSDSSVIVRSPNVLFNKESLDAWWTKLGTLILEHSTWLNTKTKREVNYLQDYIVNLNRHLSHIPSEKYPLVGVIVRQDFVDISSHLEKTSYKFFKGEVRQLKLPNLNRWHKFKIPKTNKRLHQTLMVTKSELIERIYKV
jgi:hypothetical protein